MWQCFWGKLSRSVICSRCLKTKLSFFRIQKTSEEFLERKMAFTAYIFQEDYDRLTTLEVAHARQNQKGGSLFGQWTSTGNPVVHRVMSFGRSQASRDGDAKELYEGFRVCYIGEWRPVLGPTSTDRQAREERELLRGPDAPARFLVLDVSRTDIVPFLSVNRQTAQQEKGRLEKLPGKNPFNKRESSEDRMPLRRDYGYLSQHAFAARAPQFQEAFIPKEQWYSGDEGRQMLQKVLKDIKEIALGDVDMSRDTKTHDISLSFIDKRKRNKWQIRFPQAFPTEGAFLIKNPGTHQQKQKLQGTSDKAPRAVMNMISCIQSDSLM